MKQLAHFVAEAANFNDDGTFTVFKGGITDLNASGFPVPFRLAIVTRLEFDTEEAAQLHELYLRVTLDGVSLGMEVRQPLAVRVDAGRPIYANVITILNLALPAPGRLAVAASVNEVALPLLYLTVNKAG